MDARQPATRRWIAGGLALGTAALYARVLWHPFIWYDDNRYVTENPMVREGLSWRGLSWALGALHASNWHPLTWLSHMLDAQLFGLWAGGHHATSILLHAANAALLFVVLSRMTLAPWRSAVVAALFAAHPLHVQSVAWVAERKDVLSTLFGLLALLVYLRFVERPSARAYAGLLVAFAASLLSKPMWVTLPFLLLLLDVWPLGRAPLVGLPVDPLAPSRPQAGWKRLVLEKLPLLALSVASSAVTVVAQHRGGSISGLELNLGSRLANAAVAYVRYAQKTFWPSELAIYYPHPKDGLPAWQVAGAAVVLVALSALAWALWRSRPWLAVGWLWFLGTLVPVIGLVQVGGQAMADRYTYLPIVGLFVAATWGACALLEKRAGRGALGAMAVGVTVLAGALTVRELGYWSDHERLFRRALEAAGESGIVHGVLSEGFRRQGKLEEALAEARLAAELSPETVRHWNNLGVSLRDLGRYAQARDALLRAVALDPEYAAGWANLAEVEQQLGNVAQAERAALEATRLAPLEAQGWYRLGLLRMANGHADEAIGHLEQAVRLNPTYTAAWNTLGALCQGLGQTGSAERAFQAAARSEPKNPVLWRNLGVYYAQTARYAEATDAFREALRRKPGDADLLHRLGRAEFALGNRAAAAAVADQLQALEPARAADLRALLAGARP